MGSLTHLGVLETSALNGEQGEIPLDQCSPAAGGKGRSAQQLASVPVPFPVFTICNHVGFLLSALLSLFFFPCFSCRRQCRRCPGILEKLGGLAQERFCSGGSPGGRMPFKLEERPQLNHAAGPQTLKPALEEAQREPRRVQIPLIQAQKQLQRYLEKCWRLKVPKLIESRRLPHSQRASTRQKPQKTPSFGFPGQSQ